jgi:hypothetical protein
MSQYTPDESTFSNSLKDCVIVISGKETYSRRSEALAYPSVEQAEQLVLEQQP